MLKLLKLTIGKSDQNTPTKIRKGSSLEKKDEKNEKIKKFDQVSKSVENDHFQSKKHQRSINHQKDVFAETVLQRRIRKLRRRQYKGESEDPDVYYDEIKRVYFCFNFEKGEYEIAGEEEMLWDENGKKKRRRKKKKKKKDRIVTRHSSSSGLEENEEKPTKKKIREKRNEMSYPRIKMKGWEDDLKFENENIERRANDKSLDGRIGLEDEVEEEDVKSDVEEIEEAYQTPKNEFNFEEKIITSTPFEDEGKKEEKKLEDSEEEEEEGELNEEESETDDDDDRAEAEEKVYLKITPEQKARIREEFIVLVGEKNEIEKSMFFFKKKFEEIQKENELLVKENIDLRNINKIGSTETPRKKVLMIDGVDDDDDDESSEDEIMNNEEKKKVKDLQEKLYEMECEKNDLEKQYNDVFKRNHELLEWNEQLEGENKELEKKIVSSTKTAKSNQKNDKDIMNSKKEEEEEEEEETKTVTKTEVGIQTSRMKKRRRLARKSLVKMSRDELEERCYDLEERLKDEKHRYYELEKTLVSENDRYEKHLKRCLDGLKDRRERLDGKEEEIERLSEKNKKLEEDLYMVKVQLQDYQRLGNDVQTKNNPFVDIEKIQ